MTRRLIGVAMFTLLGIVLVLPVRAEVTHSVNPDNGLQGWHFSAGDIEIELIQRLPDQTRALFMKHEFSRDVIEQLALSCMFQTIIRNSNVSGSGQTVSIDLSRWRMHHAGKETGILLKEPLLDSWSDADASPAAKLVVRWGMFPTQQDYFPGDYNWGLTAYGITPGSGFDLEVNWMEGQVAHSGRITDIICAPDVDKLK
ncbi:MAG: hypothetical protein ABFS22_12920 [Pseudomonadota bacterium]